tara:strand:- start:579 stop:815 length:237 start_codon:yes stop_codon:yes gene_type:complete
MQNKLIKIAEKYRSKTGRTCGVVLIFNGEVYGWKNELRDPQCEQPGAVAVDDSGNLWTATGGDSYNGAKQWASSDKAA